jgi:hypothetical protein
VVDECAKPLFTTADGTISPLRCGGKLNATAWKYLAGQGLPLVMTLGSRASSKDVGRALCSDLQHNRLGATAELEANAYDVTARYYGWRFAISPKLAFLQNGCLATPSTTVPTTPTTAPPGRTYAVTTNLTVRTGPGTSFPEVGVVGDGTQIAVACTTPGESINGPFGADSHWDKISLAGQGNSPEETGYVTDEYVDTKGDIDNPSLIPVC